MNTELYNRILEDHKELSSLPQTLAEVIRVIKDEKASAQDLAAVLSHDPALTAKILRIVNSPYYGPAREITTLSQAVVTLGTRAISALALSTSIYDVASKWESSIDRLRFWRHSLEVAIACRMIAESSGYPSPEEAFVCGLLHDIGLLVLERSFPEKLRSLWKRAESGETLVELEENAWGTNHARVGQFLLEQWHVPSVISEAVGQHHSSFPPRTYDPEFQLPQIVALGNRISKLRIAETRPELPYDVETKDILKENLHIQHEALKSIEEQLFGRLVEEAAFLEMEIGSPQDLLTEANKMLYRQYLTAEGLLRENRQMQQEIAHAKLEKAALETVRTIAATFNHYVNNAAATILGRAQLIELSVENGEIRDRDGKTAGAMQVIVQCVNTIQLVLEELRKLDAFKTTVYHDDTYIIDIEEKIKRQLKQIGRAESVS